MPIVKGVFISPNDIGLKCQADCPQMLWFKKIPNVKFPQLLQLIRNYFNEEKGCW